MLKIKSFIVLCLVFCCSVAWADAGPELTTVSVCCYGEDMTKQTCCEQNGGAWCETDQSCRQLGTTAIADSPCMNAQLCKDLYIYGGYCPETNTCYQDYWYYLVSDCPSVKKEECDGERGKLKWCDKTNRCYFKSIVREPHYSTYCI